MRKGEAGALGGQKLKGGGNSAIFRLKKIIKSETPLGISSAAGRYSQKSNSRAGVKYLGTCTSDAEAQGKLSGKKTKYSVRNFFCQCSSLTFLCVIAEVALAARLGVEPRQNESESFVLPLHHRAVGKV